MVELTEELKEITWATTEKKTKELTELLRAHGFFAGAFVQIRQTLKTNIKGKLKPTTDRTKAVAIARNDSDENGWVEVDLLAL